MQLKSKYGYILATTFFFFFLILTPLGVFNDWVPPEIHKGYYSVTKIDQGDDTGYYAFLRSLFFDGDIDFFNEKNYAHFDNITSTGFAFNNWQIGQGILFFPFFLIGHLFAIILNAFGLTTSLDGYSTPYYLSTAIASHTYLFIGLLHLSRLIKQFTTEKIALIAVIAIWIASPLLYYSFIRQRMAHTVEFFMAVIFFSAWLQKRRSQNHIDHALLGALLGFFCVIRIINISFFALYFIDQLSSLKNNSIAERQFLFKNIINRSIWVFLSFLIVLSPQLLVWQTLNGVPLPTRHFEMAGAGLSFLLSPDLFKKFLDIFFSPKWGLIFSFPISIIAVIGLFSEKKFADIRLGILAYLASIVFIIAVYPENSDSYGERHFISSIPLLVLGLVGALNWASRDKQKKYFLYGLLILCVSWQYILIIEYKTYLTYNAPHYSISALEELKTIINHEPLDFLRSSNIFRVLLSKKPISWSYVDFLFLIGFPLIQLIFLSLSIFAFQSAIIQKTTKKIFQTHLLVKGFVIFSMALIIYLVATTEKLSLEEQKRRKNFRKITDKTRLAIDEQDFSAAIKLGIQSNQLYPNHWLPYLQIGLSWQALGKYDEALDYYYKVIKENPKNFFALSRIGEIYIKQANWKDAKTYLTRARSIDPLSSKIYNYLGQAETKLKNLDNAEKMFLTAIKLDNRYGDFHANLAVVYFIKAEHKKAMSQLIQAKLLGFESDTTKKLFELYGIEITKGNSKRQGSIQSKSKN